jgi:putative DNA-invertase from lambdoid prophage Rac
VAKIYGYIRAQVNPAQKGSADLQAQRDDLFAFAGRRRFSFDKIFCDDAELPAESMMGRDEGRRLLNILQRGDTVVSPSLDRLFLTLDDAQRVIQRFLEKRVQLLLVNFDAVVEYTQFLAILPAIQSAELERRSLFIRAGKKKRKLKGGFIGGAVPFGWALGSNGDLIEEPNEQRKIGMARDYQKKGYSWRRIARLLSQSGRKGRTISHVTIRRILKPKNLAPND